MSNLVSVRLEMMLVSVQDWCTICAKHTIGSFWTHPIVLLGHEAQVEAHLSLFAGSNDLDARQVNGLPKVL
jgi:hypothetical protein